MKLKRFSIWSLVAALTFTGLPAPASASVANVLRNPGFELPLGGSNNWNNDAGRGITVISAGAPVGSNFLRLDESQIAVGQFSFTFQTVTGVSPGARVSLSALARETLQPADNEDGELRIEFQTAGGTFISSIESSITTTTFARHFVSGIAPSGTGQVTFTLRIQNTEDDGTGTTTVDFDDLIATVSTHPVVLSSATSSITTSPGDLTTAIVRVDNTTSSPLTNVEVVATPQAGLNIRPQDASLNGQRVDSRDGSVIFTIGTLVPAAESILTFPLLLTSGVVPGKTYEVSLFARSSTGTGLSQEIRIQVRAELDPVFDEGTIIGKVFNDLNQNGVQDSCVSTEGEERCTGGEKGVPWVKLVTEEGIIIVTDEHGRYHIPAVRPGRHLVKIDGHSLPEGTKFITEEAFLVKSTPGIMSKANFAVLLPPSDIPQDFQDALSVNFTQGLDTARPTLQVRMEPFVLKTSLGILEKEAVFKFKLNYPDFVKNWYLEVRDELGFEVWTGFGVSAPPSEVTWAGQTEDGLLIKPGVYSYQLKVEDYDGHQDWTPLNFFRVLSKADASTQEKKLAEIPPVGDFNIFKDGKSSIPLVAKPTVRVQGKTKPGYKISVNAQPIEVNTDTGYFNHEFYVTPGDKEFLVEAVSPEGEVTSYKKAMKVKDSTFFMVALGEQELGLNMADGNLAAAANDPQYKNSFYQDGRLSYFLKGKLKGKFLVKSKYDTSDERTALFTNLDPDDYYPVYGDDSTIDYEGLNTRQRFYMLIEMDRSFVRWGSFQTAFTDTELSTYNRTLSGLQVNYESLQSTPYGDPKKGFKLFTAEARHQADHNEFAATGGSLYYVRYRNVIQGSEQIRVEVRDKIQDMTIASYDLKEGTDYEIDYANGRIMLTRPLSSVAASDTLISADILDGSPVYLVVDYEFDPGASAFERKNRGLRGFTHFGDHLRFGATAVQEERHLGHGNNYDMRGIDVQLKGGRNTKITAEYAETKQEQREQGVSFDGGMSFADLNLIRGENSRTRENAYLIRGETKPFKSMDVSGYVQGLEPSFSNNQLRSQEGTKKYGLATKYKVTENLYARYRYDHAEVIGQLLPLTSANIRAEYENKVSHTAQLVYDNGKWLAQTEYLRQMVDLPQDPASRIASLFSEYPFDHAVSAKLGYHVTDGFLPYVKVQTAIHEERNFQAGGGVRYELVKDTFAYVEQMFGTVGDSTLFGLEKQHDEKMRSYANIRMRDQGVGTKTLSSAIGSSYSLTEQSRIYSERERSTYEAIDGQADVTGYEGKLNDHWDYDLRYERRHLDGSGSRLLDQEAANSLRRTNTFNTYSGALGYKNGEKFRVRTYLEGRRDQDIPKMLQWVTRNDLEYRITQDLRFLGKLDFGKSRFLDPNDTPADFMEFSTGFAFRPVDNDKLNALTRYTYLRDKSNDFQFAQQFLGVETDQAAHIMAIDLAYDIHRYFGIVEKLAYKTATYNSSVSNEMILHTFLSVHRLNMHITRKWDLALEYRMLWQFDVAQSLKQGALIEIDREFYDYVRLGVGYNFTDFDDDIRNTNDYDSHGPFVRMTGKF